MLNTCAQYVNNKSIRIGKVCIKLYTGTYEYIKYHTNQRISSLFISINNPPFTPIYTQIKSQFNRYRPSLLPAIHSTYYYKNEKKIKKGTQ
jgi:hypothetical protein